VSESYFPFDSGPGATLNEQNWRDLSLALGAANPGVIGGYENNMEIFGDSTAGIVKVRTGRVSCFGHYYVSTSEISIAVNNNATGQRRVDQVVTEFDFVNNVVATKLVVGGTSPTPLTQDRSTVWQVLLGYVLTPTGSPPIISSGVVVPCLDRYTVGPAPVPVGGGLDYYLVAGAVPVGYVLARGQTLSSWALPKMRDIMIFTNQGLGTSGAEWGYDAPNEQIKVPDLRGRTGIGVGNMGGSDAGRLNALFHPTGLGRTGGLDIVTLVAAQMAGHTHAVTGNTGIESQGHAHAITAAGVEDAQFAIHTPTDFQAGQELSSGSGGGTGRALTSRSLTNIEDATHFHAINIQTGTIFGVTHDQPHENLGPYVQCNKIVRVA
jgi:microcystin-dependent protein